MATPGASNESTFGKSLMTYIASRLPYSQNYEILDNISKLNPKYKEFFDTGTRSQDLIAKHSIVSSTNNSSIPFPGVGIDKNYHAFMYANVDFDKSKRLRDYRVMAQFSEVADALDEICDECLNRDGKGDYIKLSLRDRDYDSNIDKDIHDEFSRFVALYNLENKGWEYFRNLLIDGEIFFEHIIHEKYTNAGILGIINIPTELVDPIYDNVQNLVIKSFLLRKPIIDLGKKSQNTKTEFIPLDRNQVTYIHSGVWNETKTIRLPFIENGRRAYRQLSLIEDSIVIYRLVRAPERLVFNVDVGNMPPPQAEAYLKKLMQNYWSKKTYDVDQGRTVQAFNPQSMLDSFWFAKRAGSEGTSVTQLPGGQNLGELNDLLYFKQKLYRALKVPVERLNPEAQATADSSALIREELKFARFIIRLQQRIASAIKEAFITHLRLKTIWDRYNLKENYLNIEFNPPTNFHELRNQQINELKWNNYSSAIQNPLISDTYAKKHMLKMSDDEIKANRELLRKDSALKWELGQIEGNGPNWQDAYTPGAEGAAMPAGGGGAMGAGSMPSMPPGFGVTPPAGGEVPEGGEGASPAATPVGPAPAGGGGGGTALP